MRTPAAVALALTLMLVAAFAANAQTPAEKEEGQCARTMEVSGQGLVKLAPTEAQVSLAAESTATKAADALEANATRTSRLMSALKPMLAEDESLTASGYELEPVYDSDKMGRSRLAGYRAVSRLTLKVKRLKELGGLIDAAVLNGANHIGGLYFGNPGTDEARKDASALALGDARALAERLAAAGGVKLGRLVRVQAHEGYIPGPPRPVYEMAAARVSTPIEPGELEVRSQVTAVWEIE